MTGTYYPIYTGRAIPPPVDVSWRHDAQAATDACIILKLNTAGPDYDRMLNCAHAAGDRICLRLDRTSPIPGVQPQTPPPVLRQAHANATVIEWRRKDAPFGVSNSWAPDTSIDILNSGDPYETEIFPVVDPYRSRWGVA